MNNHRIRLATAADLDTVVAFNKAIASETEDKTLDSAVITLGVRQALADPDRARYFLVEVDGQVVGQTMLTTEWSDWRNGYFWWIQSVYVAPDHRGHGLFRALYEHVRNLAKQAEGVCGLRLYVYRDNRQALDIYKKLGMDVTDYLLCEEEWPAPDIKE